MPIRFLQQQMKHPEVWSGRENACRYDSTATYRTNLSEASCPLRDTCQQSSTLYAIHQCYGKGIVATLAEPSASPVVRIECTLNPSLEHRESIRKHLFEVTNHGAEHLMYRINDSTIQSLKKHLLEGLKSRKNPHPDVAKVIESYCQELARDIGEFKGEVAKMKVETSINRANVPKRYETQFRSISKIVFGSSLQCFRDDSVERELGKYLGFVDLRLYAHVASVALALLCPPRAVRHDPDAFVITGNYAEIFGGHGFECSPYSMQDPFSSDGKCVQTCIVMVLAHLSDRGAKVIGTLDISARQIERKDLREYLTGVKIVSTPSDLGLTGAWKIGGLSPAQACLIINREPSIGVNAHLAELSL